MTNYQLKKNGYTCKRKMSIVKIILIILGILGIMFTFRYDYKSGSHKITPTAIDKTFAGHYKVYYKINEFTSEEQEKFYFIEKNQEDIIHTIETAINKNRTVLVSYDVYIGFKGFGSPNSSPIIKAKIVY